MPTRLAAPPLAALTGTALGQLSDVLFSLHRGAHRTRSSGQRRLTAKNSTIGSSVAPQIWPSFAAVRAADRATSTRLPPRSFKQTATHSPAWSSSDRQRKEKRASRCPTDSQRALPSSRNLRRNSTQGVGVGRLGASQARVRLSLQGQHVNVSRCYQSIRHGYRQAQHPVGRSLRTFGIN